MTAQPNSPPPREDAPALAARRGFWRRVRHPLVEIGLTLPSCGWMIVFFLIPSILLFTLSFHPTATDGGIGDKARHGGIRLARAYKPGHASSR